MIKNKCKACRKVYEGTHEELLNIFTWNSRRSKYGDLCKTCAKEYQATRRWLESNGSRVTAEELIEVLDKEGYPFTKKKLDEFIKESYIECDLGFNKWVEWISKSFYSNDKVKEVLEGNIKKCTCCNKWLPILNYYKNTNIRKGKRYHYTQTNCKKCFMVNLKEKWSKVDSKKRKEYQRAWEERSGFDKAKYDSEYRKKNLEKTRKHNRKSWFRTWLKENNYDFTENQLNLLMEFKEEENIRYYKDLVERFGDAVCLKKI
ncbi:MAG: hypothetical protein ACRDB0_05070 [Paraclostridium sp.]